jgi:hypothetical protein
VDLKKLIFFMYLDKYAGAQLVEALRYKPEGRGFIPDGVFFIDIILSVQLQPWVRLSF